MGDVLRTGRVAAWSDRRAQAVFGPDRYDGIIDFAGDLIAPLIHHDRVIGALSAATLASRDWTGTDVELATALATTAAIAIHNADLFAQTERRAAHLAVVQAASARMSRASSVEGVGRAIVEETRRIIDYHNARVYLIEASGDVIPIAFEGSVGAYEQVDLSLLRVKLGEGFTGWVAEHGQPLLVNDANGDPRGATIAGTDAVDESMLVVPMRYDDQTIGVITLSKLGMDQFSADDLRLLSILADQAATALESARLLERSDALAGELRRLLAMSSALAQSLDPREVADLIAAHLAVALQVDECAISYWDRPTMALRTLGYFPPASLAELEPSYDVSQFPETRRALERREIVIVDGTDPRADPNEVALMAKENLLGLAMVPLVVKGQSIGLVELLSHEPMAWAPGRLAFARTMANEAAMALENARLYENARALADRDPLTGFYNHRFLHERLGEEVIRAQRARRPVSVLMLDLDDFKLVNDTFGHVFGDRVLLWTADRIRSTLRAPDVGARYAGDEFAIILPETDASAARHAAQRILDAFAASPFGDGDRNVPIALSIGAATHPTDGRTPTDLIAAADQALYQVKAAGGTKPSAAGGRRRRLRRSRRPGPRTRPDDPEVLVRTRHPYHPADVDAERPRTAILYSLTSTATDRCAPRPPRPVGSPYPPGLAGLPPRHSADRSVAASSSGRRPTRLGRPLDWVLPALLVLAGRRGAALLPRGRWRPPSTPGVGARRHPSPGSSAACHGRSRRTPSSARSSTSSATPPEPTTSSSSGAGRTPGSLEARLVSSHPGVPDPLDAAPADDLDDPVGGRPVSPGEAADRSRPTRVRDGLRPRPKAMAGAAGRARWRRRGDRPVAAPASPGRSRPGGCCVAPPEASAALARTDTHRAAEAGDDGRPDRPPEPPLLRRVRGAAGPASPGRRPGRDPHGRHRPLQGAQRPPRPRRRRRGAARRGPAIARPSATSTSRRATAARSSSSCCRDPDPGVALEVGERIREAVRALDLRAVRGRGRQRLGRRRRRRRPDAAGRGPGRGRRPGAVPRQARRARPGRGRLTPAGQARASAPPRAANRRPPRDVPSPACLAVSRAPTRRPRPPRPATWTRPSTPTCSARPMRTPPTPDQRRPRARSSTRSATCSRSRASSSSRPSPTTAPPTPSAAARSTSPRAYREGRAPEIPGVGRGDQRQDRASWPPPAGWPSTSGSAAEVPPTLVELLRIPGVGPKTVRLLYERARHRDARRTCGGAAEAGTLRGAAGPLGADASSSSSRGSRGSSRRPTRMLLDRAERIVDGVIARSRTRRAVAASSRPARSAVAARRSATSTCSRRRPTRPASDRALHDARRSSSSVLNAGRAQGGGPARRAARRWTSWSCRPGAAGTYLIHFTGSQGAQRPAPRARPRPGLEPVGEGLPADRRGRRAADRRRDAELRTFATEAEAYAFLGPAVHRARAARGPRARSRRRSRAGCRRLVELADLRGDLPHPLRLVRRHPPDRGHGRGRPPARVRLPGPDRPLAVAGDRPRPRPGAGRRSSARSSPRSTTGSPREEAAGTAPPETPPEGFRLLHGCELEIRADGALDFEDELLARFDLVVASVHVGAPPAARRADRAGR